METNKLALKLSALAGVAVSGSVSTHAAIVASPTVGAGISPPGSHGINNWDVDNDSVVDFALFKNASSSSFFFANFDERNGGRLVAPASASNRGISKFAIDSGVVVEAIMAGHKFFNSPQNYNTITSNGSGVGNAAVGGWSYGDTGYFGFKFTSEGNTHYGWGKLVIGTPTGYTITEAYYETTPDLGIEIGSTSSIPEPAASAALLGLGVAGVAAWRRRRNA